MPRSVFEVMGDTNDLIQPEQQQVTARPVDTFVRGESAQNILSQSKTYQTAKAIETLVSKGTEAFADIDEARIKSDAFDANIQYQDADSKWQRWKVENSATYEGMSPAEREQEFNKFFSPVISEDFHPRVRQQISKTISDDLYKENVSMVPLDFERGVTQKANTLFDSFSSQKFETEDEANAWFNNQVLEFTKFFDLPQSEVNALIREKAIADLSVGKDAVYNYAEKFKMFGTSESIRAGDDKRLSTALSAYNTAIEKQTLINNANSLVSSVENNKPFEKVYSDDEYKKADEILEKNRREAESYYLNIYVTAEAAEIAGNVSLSDEDKVKLKKKALAAKEQYKVEIATSARQFSRLGLKNDDHDQYLNTALSKLTSGASLVDSSAILNGLTIYETYKTDAPELLDEMLTSEQKADYEVALKTFNREGLVEAIAFMKTPKIEKVNIKNKVDSNDLADTFDGFAFGFGSLMRRPSDVENLAGEYVDYAISLQQRRYSKSLAISEAKRAFQSNYMKLEGSLVDLRPINQGIFRAQAKGKVVDRTNIPDIFEEYINYVKDIIPAIDNDDLTFQYAGQDQYRLVTTEGNTAMIDDDADPIDIIVTTDELLKIFEDARLKKLRK